MHQRMWCLDYVYKSYEGSKLLGMKVRRTSPIIEIIVNICNKEIQGRIGCSIWQECLGVRSGVRSCSRNNVAMT